MRLTCFTTNTKKVPIAALRRAPAGRSSRLIHEIIAWAERYFGPYPFSSVGAIVERAKPSISSPSSV
jgi:hypothetical protein